MRLSHLSRDVIAESPTWRVVLEPDPDADSPLIAYRHPFHLVSWVNNVPGTGSTLHEAPEVWAERWLARQRDGQLWPVWAYRYGAIALRFGDTRAFRTLLGTSGVSAMAW